MSNILKLKEALNNISSLDVEDVVNNSFGISVEYADNDNYAISSIDTEINRKLYVGDEISIDELTDIIEYLINNGEQTAEHCLKSIEELTE